MKEYGDDRTACITRHPSHCIYSFPCSRTTERSHDQRDAAHRRRRGVAAACQPQPTAERPRRLCGLMAKEIYFAALLLEEEEIAAAAAAALSAAAAVAAAAELPPGYRAIGRRQAFR